MVVQVPVKGYFEENCFFYIDEHTKHGFLIDPGAQAGALLGLIREHGQSICDRIMTLPVETVLFNGHSERTSVGAERDRYQICG